MNCIKRLTNSIKRTACALLAKKTAKKCSLSQIKARETSSNLDFKHEYFFVFTGHGQYFGSQMLKRNFNHCFVIQRCKEFYMLLDPTYYGLLWFTPVCSSDYEFIENLMNIEKNATVVQVLVNKTTKQLNKPRLLSCVNLCQYFAGIRVKYAVTPFQLYNRIIHSNSKCFEATEICLQENQQQKKQQEVQKKPRQHQTYALKN